LRLQKHQACAVQIEQFSRDDDDGDSSAALNPFQLHNNCCCF
jgi:hypothetical protein